MVSFCWCASCLWPEQHNGTRVITVNGVRGQNRTMEEMVVRYLSCFFVGLVVLALNVFLTELCIYSPTFIRVQKINWIKYFLWPKKKKKTKRKLILKYRRGRAAEIPKLVWFKLCWSRIPAHRASLGFSIHLSIIKSSSRSATVRC